MELHSFRHFYKNTHSRFHYHIPNLSKSLDIELTHSLSEQALEELMAGGKLTLIKQKHA